MSESLHIVPKGGVLTVLTRPKNKLLHRTPESSHETGKTYVIECLLRPMWGRPLVVVVEIRVTERQTDLPSTPVLLQSNLVSLRTPSVPATSQTGSTFTRTPRTGQEVQVDPFGSEVSRLSVPGVYDEWRRS